MDQIQAMRIFTRVVEAGTFTRAADSLSLPKATVTKHVQALEERLRVKLLNRTTRRVTVTADGAAYYERTVRLLSDLDDIEASMTNARANPDSHNLNTVDALLLIGGGVPLRIGTEVIGAIGVGGAGCAVQDEACALQAIAKVLPAASPAPAH